MGGTRVGWGAWVGAIVGLGVGVGVGFSVGTSAGVGVSVATGLLRTAACSVVGVGVGVEATLLLLMAEPMQEKNRRTAMIAPHPMPTFIRVLLALYHCHRFPRDLPGAGWYGDTPWWN